MSRGGYRRPNNPAPVSGPGKLSRRTDGGPADTQPARPITDLPYGEGQEAIAVQRSAPMAAAAEPKQAAFNAPTEYPDEPISAGASWGPGPGPEALPRQQQDDTVAALIRYAYALHPSPGLHTLMNYLEAEGR